MCGEKIQIHDRIPLKRWLNGQIHMKIGHRLSFSQKEHAQIAAVYCHSNRAHFIQAFPFNQFAFAIPTNSTQSLGLGRVPERKFFFFFLILLWFSWQCQSRGSHLIQRVIVGSFFSFNFQAKTGLVDHVFGVYKMWNRVFAHLFANGRGKEKSQNLCNERSKCDGKVSIRVIVVVVVVRIYAIRCEIGTKKKRMKKIHWNCRINHDREKQNWTKML